MEQEEIIHNQSNQEQNQNLLRTAKQSKNLLFLVALVSIIAGSVGGAFGSQSLSKLFKSKDLDSVLGTKTISIQEESVVIDVVKKASPAVVSVVISKDISKQQTFGFSPFGFDPFFNFSQPNQTTEPNIQEVGAGSGFFITQDGLILTNKHVVSDESATYSVVTNENKSYPAKVLAVDPVNDLAIIKIDISGAPVLELADSQGLQIGQRVIAIGNSLGQYQNTVTTGIVSGIGRSITAGSSDGTEQLEGVIQTDAAINPGNSGGPLLNSAGQVIGINTAVDRGGQLVGFAIPSNDAKNALESYQKNGKISRPRLGVRYVLITPEFAKKNQLAKDYGALILGGGTVQTPAVMPGSSAEQAGLKENDIILEVNNQRISEKFTLPRALKNFKVGDSVTLKVYSGGSEKDVTVILGEAK